MAEKNINKQTIRLYWQQVKQHKVSFFIMLISIPLSAVLISSLLPYAFSQAVGMIAAHKTEESLNFLRLAAAAGTTGALLNLIGFQAMVRHESKVITKNRNETFKTLLQKDLSFFTDHMIGAMTSKFIDYIRSETIIQDLFIIRTFGFVLTIVAGVGFMVTQSIPVACVVIALIGFLIVEVRWSLKKREKWRNERRKVRSEIHGHVADSLTNSLVVKTFANEDTELEKMRGFGTQFDYAYKKDFGFTSLEGSSRVAIMTITQIIAVGLCIFLAAKGDIEIATIVFVISYLQLVGSQIFTIGELMNGYEEALLEASPMTTMLLHENRLVDENNAVPLTTISPLIKFENVSYAYSDNKRHVIDSVSFTIPSGQKVGLVGHSGAGKSTITQLLLRLDDPIKGRIQIDNNNIRKVSQKSLRKHIAYVPQDSMLFHRTLRENISYGKEDASDDEIFEAAKRANALDFIEKLPHKFDTLVGERGVKLSGGQRQRIAIARAILKDAPILLLDEATSALDSESEKLIQLSLENLMKNRTSIVIAHRLSTIAKLDRIIVLDSGKIIEDGSHQELLKKKGTYAKLWAHQSGGFIEE